MKKDHKQSKFLHQNMNTGDQGQSSAFKREQGGKGGKEKTFWRLELVVIWHYLHSVKNLKKKNHIL